IQPDDRRADPHCRIHDFDDLGCVGFRKGAAEDSKVLREDEDGTAIDAAVSSNEAIPRDALLFHAKVGTAVSDQLVRLFECAFIEQQMYPLAGGKFSFPVLALTALLAAAFFGETVAAFQFFKRFSVDSLLRCLHEVGL